jgi:hypothetical protein
MDLVGLIKRMRVQGMLLAMLFSPRTLKIVAGQGESKILDENAPATKKTGFAK